MRNLCFKEERQGLLVLARRTPGDCSCEAGMGLAWPQLLSSPTDRLTLWPSPPPPPGSSTPRTPWTLDQRVALQTLAIPMPASHGVQHLLQNPRQAGQIFSSLTIPCPMRRSCFNKHCQSRWPRSCRGLLAAPGIDAEEGCVSNACLWHGHSSFRGGLSDLGPRGSGIAWIYLKPEQLRREFCRGRF